MSEELSKELRCWTLLTLLDFAKCQEGLLCKTSCKMLTQLNSTLKLSTLALCQSREDLEVFLTKSLPFIGSSRSQPMERLRKFSILCLGPKPQKFWRTCHSSSPFIGCGRQNNGRPPGYLVCAKMQFETFFNNSFYFIVNNNRNNGIWYNLLTQSYAKIKQSSICDEW
jgi:hypothetical protein